MSCARTDLILLEPYGAVQSRDLFAGEGDAAVGVPRGRVVVVVVCGDGVR